jgi:hypothetical protein
VEPGATTAEDDEDDDDDGREVVVEATAGGCGSDGGLDVTARAIVAVSRRTVGCALADDEDEDVGAATGPDVADDDADPPLAC